MKISRVRSGFMALLLLALAACGGGDGGTAPPPAPEPDTLAGTIATAAALAANDTATNSSASFTVLQAAGVPAVTVESPPKVNFAVFSDGAVKTGVAITDLSVAIAKLVPGTSGNPDRWVNYIYRTETATAGVGPNGTPALATASQATTDGKHEDEALLAQQLVYNEDGYYTYTFKTDITDPDQTHGVSYEPGRTHRVAIQLSYVNAAGETVRVNPYFDFTIDDEGRSVPVTDPDKTRKMTDVSSCNSCHEKLALHGGGRVDTQFCVMCHNPGTTDANSGNNLNLATMAHKIHAGKLLKSQIDEGGEDYAIWGFRDSKHDYAEVGFPQDLRNCTKCHSGDNPNTPQGDNWKTVPSKEACLTCHANKTGSPWNTRHTIFAGELVGAGKTATDLSNQQCADCHKPGSNISPERVHWNQVEEHAAKFKMNIESTSYNAATRIVTVKYFLSDPTNGDAAYNLVTPDCTAAAPTVCAVPDPESSRINATKFGNLRFYLAYQNLVGQSTAVTEFSAYNNGGSDANAYAYLGTNDGNNHYTVQIAVPADSETAVAAGTARVISIGQVREPKLQAKWATDPRPAVSPQQLVNTVVQHTYSDVALSGPVIPRRVIVANEKCNACHGALGTTSGSNTLANAFHSGARNTVEACVTCHDVNRASSTIMTNGLALNESYQFKRMIHGIHGNSKRTYPFTHGNKIVGAFGMDGFLLSDGVTPLTEGTENYAAEVAWPGVGLNCNACHVDNSYKVDMGPLGAVVSKPEGVNDPLQWLVISPKAATCTACHDSANAIAHVTSFGNASFANLTQAQSVLNQETCADCHSSGGFKGVDIVHGQK
ncbi:OmcA/MtrC family decaheme c-type cytochrome [Piscinibacter sp.]|uniref:OmcA/MtrC family decaheme c-type cytochrome n=1 Tax=Piscinibacter sp. TaxID=1903157 RepID=UPI002BD909B8|nr:OmcA/MtrC family decaheme c-type cytochrome [Albitalea sp.]HUG22387.1 OmcA/MtrC family decaheme c-type cytochrome [Albitalea sp.]